MTLKEERQKYSRLTKWINGMPLKPKDVVVKVSQGCTGFTPAKGYTTFKNREELNIIIRYINGADWFYDYLKEKGVL